MALSEKTVSKHNIKRAEAFAKHGLNTLDLNTVHPRFSGYSRGREEECILCGQQHLKWLFELHFDEPQGLVALAKVDTGIDREGAVTLKPVGSKCIHDWIDALPETAEKLELLKRWEREMVAMKAAMRAKIVEDLCRAAGYETPELAAKAATDIFMSRLSTSGRDEYFTAHYAVGRVEMRWFSKRIGKIHDKVATKPTTMRWLAALGKAVAAIEARRAARPALVVTSTAPAVTPTTGPKMLPEIRELLDKGKAAFANKPNVLAGKALADFQDIAKKVETIGYFTTSAQARYYRDLVARLERGP